MALFVDWFVRDEDDFRRLVNDPLALAQAGLDVFPVPVWREGITRDDVARASGDPTVIAEMFGTSGSVEIGIAVISIAGHIVSGRINPSIPLDQIANQLDDLTADGANLRRPNWRRPA